MFFFPNCSLYNITVLGCSFWQVSNATNTAAPQANMCRKISTAPQIEMLIDFCNHPFLRAALSRVVTSQGRGSILSLRGFEATPLWCASLRASDGGCGCLRSVKTPPRTGMPSSGDGKTNQNRHGTPTRTAVQSLPLRQRHDLTEKERLWS